jgi:hypothetical protein
MTRIPKADAQLDAEAAGQGYSLRWFIIDLRRAFRYEVPDCLHEQHTSKSPGDELDARGWPKDADEGGVGLPFSRKMHRYLRTNAPRWDRGPDPQVRPAMASVQRVSEWCHTVHTSHLRPGSTRSLCAEMLFQVGYLGQEPEDMAWLHGLEPQRVDRLLLGALRKAHEWRYDSEQRLSRMPGTEEPMPERRREARAV